MSQGQLDPHYYAFFDDDILYDRQWVPQDVGELQNEIEDRIQDFTPRLKQPTTYTGVETLVNFNAEIIRSTISEIYGNANPPHIVHDTLTHQIYNQEALQPAGDQFEFLSMPLGTSDISSKYYPSWNVAMLKGEIGDSQNYLATSKRSIADIHPPIDDPIPTYRYEQIPQIEITASHKIYVGVIQTFQNASVLLEGENESQICAANATFPMPSSPPSVGTSGEFYAPQFKEISSQVYDDGTFYAITDGTVIIDVLENNVLFKKENFDIQVFMSSSTYSDPGGMPKLLYFINNAIDIPTGDDIENYISLTRDSDINDAAITRTSIGDLSRLTTDSSTTNVISTREFLLRDLYRPEKENCEE